MESACGNPTVGEAVGSAIPPKLGSEKENYEGHKVHKLLLKYPASGKTTVKVCEYKQGLYGNLTKPILLDRKSVV